MTSTTSKPRKKSRKPAGSDQQRSGQSRPNRDQRSGSRPGKSAGNRSNSRNKANRHRNGKRNGQHDQNRSQHESAHQSPPVEDVAVEPNGFTDLGVPAAIVASLSRQGITEPRPIQLAAIPSALAGKDIRGKAPTGSGKTLAFGIPLVNGLQKAQPRRPKALVVAPTRELANQIRAEIAQILPKGRYVAAFYGGTSYSPQIKSLNRGVDIAVVCPGRVLDLASSDNISFADVETVVLDEADRMADMGFLPEVKEILNMCPADRQTVLFSATLDGAVDGLSRQYQTDPVECDVAEDPRHGTRTTHEFLPTPQARRLDVTVDLINTHGSTVLFCRTKRGVDRVTADLQNAGLNAVPIHGDRSQKQRERALASFSQNRANVLVATDVAARGIHVDNVSCVIHYDLPEDTKDYVHRSGRTGRAGAKGTVITLVTEKDRGRADRLQRTLNGEAPHGSIGRPSRNSRNGSRNGRSGQRNNRSSYRGNRGRSHQR